MKATILPAAAVLFAASTFLESATADPPSRAATQAFRRFEKAIEAIETTIWERKSVGTGDLEAKLVELRGAIWTGNLAATAEGSEILSEMASGDDLDTLKREVSRLTHPDRTPRRWSNRAETREIEATLEAYDEKTGLADLKLANETICRVQIANLCDYDRDWIERRLGRKTFDRPPLRLSDSPKRY